MFQEVSLGSGFVLAVLLRQHLVSRRGLLETSVVSYARHPRSQKEGKEIHAGGRVTITYKIRFHWGCAKCLSVRRIQYYGCAGEQQGDTGNKMLLFPILYEVCD